MKPVSISKTNLLELQARGKSSDSIEFQSEAPQLQSSGTINFPLLPSSEDHLSSAFEDDQPDSYTSVHTQNYKQYLKILQAASSPSFQTDKPFQFDTVSPEILNRLDISQGAAPLHYACLNGNIQMVNFLLENGAEVDIWDAGKRVTPFICAAAHGHLMVVEALMDYDCNLNAGLNNNNSNTEQFSGLHWAVRGNHPQIVNFLLDNNVYKNSLIPFSETPIHAAVMVGSPEILSMLISAQDKSDFQMGSEKNSPLHLAASGEYENSFALCKILIEDGNADVNSLNSSDKTPLHKAMGSQNADIVKLLLFHSAKVDAVDNEGKTPLFYGICDKREALDCMETLIKEGKCNVDHQDKHGNTTLHLAGMHGAAAAVEILLLYGADFSLKAAGGISALSILKKKISATSVLLTKSFDQAITLTNYKECEEAKTRQDCKVVVDFKYVLPSEATPTTASTTLSESKPCVKRISSIFKDVEGNNRGTFARNETSKIKCLIREKYFSTLLHPVIQTFLELKWQKARPIFLLTLIFKGILVALFTLYLQMPYWTDKKENEESRSFTAEDSAQQLIMLTKLYFGIIIMAIMRAFTEVIAIIRTPRQRLQSFHFWMSTAILLCMIFNNDPETWQKTYSFPLQRSLAAMGICFVWLELWVSMARLPRWGQSIRVCLQVLKSFAFFVLPHFCLLSGFILSFTILFPGNAEYQSFGMGAAKIIRIMAGDVTIPPKGSEKALQVGDPDDLIYSQILAVFMFTACVLFVSIVLMDLLIGLAVNDIKKIYEEASTDRLKKQTMLLNILETSVCKKCLRCCFPHGIFSKFINLFPASSSDKTISFNPYDMHGLQISEEKRKDLLRIGSVNREMERAQKVKSGPPTSNNAPLSRKAAIINKFKNFRKDDQQHLLIENINKLKLVMSYLEDKLPKT